MKIDSTTTRRMALHRDKSARANGVGAWYRCHRQIPIVLAAGIAFVVAGSGILSDAHAQSRPTASTKTLSDAIPRSPDGRPDLTGVWSFATITPLERPQGFAGKEFLTPQERATLERRDAAVHEAYRQGKTAGTPTGTYGADFWERGVSTERTSLIIDPPDGRIPPLTPDAMERRRLRAERMTAAASPEDRSVGGRSILGLNAGPPMLPGAYT